VEYTDSLLTPTTWNSLPAVQGTGADATVSQSNPESNARYYRVKVDNP